MSASNNFITKPVLSTVCSLLIVIVGLIAIPILPIDNSPAEIALGRLSLFYLMLISSGVSAWAAGLSPSRVLSPLAAIWACTRPRS